VNYYDHNILGLSNRVLTKLNTVKDEFIFDSINVLRGSKSCSNVLHIVIVDKRTSHG